MPTTDSFPTEDNVYHCWWVNTFEDGA